MDVPLLTDDGSLGFRLRLSAVLAVLWVFVALGGLGLLHMAKQHSDTKVVSQSVQQIPVDQ